MESLLEDSFGVVAAVENLPGPEVSFSCTAKCLRIESLLLCHKQNYSCSKFAVTEEGMHCGIHMENSAVLH